MIYDVRIIIFVSASGVFNPGDMLTVQYDDSLVPSPVNLGTDGFSLLVNGVPSAITDSLPPYENGHWYDAASSGVQSYCNGTDLVELVPYGLAFPYAFTGVTPNSPSCSIWTCDLINTITTVFPATSELTPDGEIQVNATSSAAGDIEGKIGVDFFYGAGTPVSNPFSGLLPGTYRIYLRDSHNCGLNFLVTVGFDSTYTPKYRLEYDKIITPLVKTRIDISGRTFTGEVTEVCGGPKPFVLKLRGEGEQNKFIPILKTECLVTLLSESEGDFHDLGTSDPSEYQVSYYIDEVLKWRGKVIPNQCQEDYKHHPYYFSFVADDGVSQLKELSFIQDDNTPFNGLQSAIKLLSYCLKKTGLDLGFRVGINLYAIDMDQAVTDDPLDQAYVDLSRYYLTDTIPTIYDVIAAILDSFNARMIQDNGFWNILRVPELVAAYNYREFDSDGDPVSNNSANPLVDVLVGTDNYFVNANHNREITSAFGKLRLNYDLGKKTNLFENGDFRLKSTYNSLTAKYEFKIDTTGFTIFNTYPLTQSYEEIDGRNVALTVYANSDLVDGSAYIETEVDQFKMGANDKITVSLIVKPPSPPVIPEGSIIGIPYVKVRFTVQYSIGVSVYLQSDGSWSTTPNVITNYVSEFNKYVEITITAPSPGTGALADGNNLTLRLFHSTVYHHDYEGFTELQAVVSAGFNRNGLRAEVVFDGGAVGLLAGDYIGYYELQNNTEVENLPYIVEPDDYNVTTNPRKWILIRFAEYDNDYGLMAIDKVSLAMPTYDTIIRESIGQLRNNKIFEKSVLHGFATTFFVTLPNLYTLYSYDALIDVNAIAFDQVYSGYFRDSAGAGFEFWKRVGVDEEDSLHGILLKDLSAQYQDSSVLLRGDIQTITYPGLIMVFTVNGIVFLPMSLEYDDKISIYSVEMIELKAGAVSPYNRAFSTGFGQDFN